jgi:hypothetical protein
MTFSMAVDWALGGFTAVEGLLSIDD